eukprot:5753713-Pyramimonas_sp.AAC.1
MKFKHELRSRLTPPPTPLKNEAPAPHVLRLHSEMTLPLETSSKFTQKSAFCLRVPTISRLRDPKTATVLYCTIP